MSEQHKLLVHSNSRIIYWFIATLASSTFVNSKWGCNNLLSLLPLPCDICVRIRAMSKPCIINSAMFSQNWRFKTGVYACYKLNECFSRWIHSCNISLPCFLGINELKQMTSLSLNTVMFDGKVRIRLECWISAKCHKFLILAYSSKVQWWT